MPLYEILCISRHQAYEDIRRLVRQTALTVLDGGGAVRSLSSWGTKQLPNPIRKQKEVVTVGDYWTMKFDASPRLLKSVHDQLRRNEAVFRCTPIKLGERLQDIVSDRAVTIEDLNDQRKPIVW